MDCKKFALQFQYVDCCFFLEGESLSALEESYRPFVESFKDPALIEDHRVLQNLLKTEDRYVPSPTYFKFVQTDSRERMRKIIVQWMYEVST